jgi:hypothetical protein
MNSCDTSTNPRILTDPHMYTYCVYSRFEYMAEFEIKSALDVITKHVIAHQWMHNKR